MVARLGKQALCPCKSGLKFGDCHGLSPEPFVNRLEESKTDSKIQPAWDAMVMAGIPFNGVHPSVIVDGKRIRFVGNKAFVRPPDQTFHEFLFSLLRGLIGNEWLERQSHLPMGSQHQISRLFQSCRDFMTVHRSKAIAEDKSHWSVEASGDISDLLTLAHDVFHLTNAGIFNGKLRRRLLDKIAFQGARYETAVAALLLRAGLKVQFVYHRHKKHHDLQAFDPITNTHLAVEAKSRHRAGGLHEPGVANIDRITRGDVAPLIGQALEQNPGGTPFVIFIDLNVPRESGIPVEQRPWFQDVWTDLQSIGEPSPEMPDEFSAIFFTNFWHPWSGATLSSGTEYLHIISHRPLFPLPTNLVGNLMAAVQNYSVVPSQV